MLRGPLLTASFRTHAITIRIIICGRADALEPIRIACFGQSQALLLCLEPASSGSGRCCQCCLQRRCQVYLASISRAEVTVAQSHSCQLVTTIAHWHCTGLTKLESITRTTGTLVNDANRPDYINSLSVQVQRRVEFVAFGDPNL